MNQYRFRLENYRAIGRADIRMDGITVIAGKNGCGKSTIARWMYAFVNYSAEFPRLIDRQLIRKVNVNIRRINGVLRNLALSSNNDRSERISSLRTFSASFFEHEERNYGTLLQEYSAMLDRVCTLLDRIFPNAEYEDLPSWLKRSLFRGSEDIVEEAPFRLLFELEYERIEQLAYMADNMKSEHSLEDMVGFISRDMAEFGEFPHSMQFEENELELITNHRFIPPLELRRVVYVDTPMALFASGESENVIWEKLMERLTDTGGQKMISLEARRLAAMIRRIIGGRVFVKDDEFNSEPELRYLREEDGLDIPVGEAATGLRSFAYLLRLIENGTLDSHTLLVIDEPEAHLHPGWIVEFARMLVLVHKMLGTKVVIASHNPDMVAAVRTIVCAERLCDSTEFYLADAETQSLRYDYKALGLNIEPIFESFNIALDRIQDYGREE